MVHGVSYESCILNKIKSVRVGAAHSNIVAGELCDSIGPTREMTSN